MGDALAVRWHHLPDDLFLEFLAIRGHEFIPIAPSISVFRGPDIYCDRGGLPAPLRLKLGRIRGTLAPEYSLPEPPDETRLPALMDYLFPIRQEGRYAGCVIVTYSLAGILDQMVPWWFAQKNEIRLTDRNERTLGQRTAGGEGRGVYTYAHDLHLPYTDITLRTDSVKGAPNLLPNLLIVVIVALTLGLFWSLAALWRDITRRMTVERALREQIAFRTAMEDSLVTSLRVYDLKGKITYVNPALCRMVGMPAESLIGLSPPCPTGHRRSWMNIGNASHSASRARSIPKASRRSSCAKGGSVFLC